MDWFWEWLKQPSTLRTLNLVIGAIAGLLGYKYQISPELWMSLVGLFVAAWTIIDGFYNKQPNKPE